MADSILANSAPVVENVTAGVTAGLGFETPWRYMTDNYTRFQIATFITASVHIVFYAMICTPSFLFQFIPYMERFKIQHDKPVTTSQEVKCMKLVMFSQLLIQPPFYVGLYYYCQIMDISFSYDTMPPWYVTLAQCFGCLVLEDAWHYFFHRALHHKSIYKYIHKIHHTFQSPFGMVAEYAHPLETMILGMGTFLGVLTFGTHLVLFWTWLWIRLVETIDVHSGYDIPLNPMHLLPFYGGAKFHDFHHMNFNGNYSSTFTWWDKLFGTDAQYKEYYREKELKKTE